MDESSLSDRSEGPSQPHLDRFGTASPMALRTSAQPAQQQDAQEHVEAHAGSQENARQQAAEIRERMRGPFKGLRLLRGSSRLADGRGCFHVQVVPGSG